MTKTRLAKLLKDAYEEGLISGLRLHGLDNKETISRFAKYIEKEWEVSETRQNADALSDPENTSFLVLLDEEEK